MHPLKPDVVIDADKLNVEPNISHSRKPTIRRKQAPKPPGKQVTFNDNNTEKIIYNDPATPAKEMPDKPESNTDASESQYHEVKDTVVPDKVATHDMELQHDENTVPSDTNFERYHNSFALGITKSEQQDDKSDKEKTTKKVRVIKRLGSSRRKPVSKITDDSDRDSLFRRPEEIGIQNLAESISSELTVAAQHTNTDSFSSAVGDIAKESSAAEEIDPAVATDSPISAVADFSVDDSLQVEELIAMSNANTVSQAPEPHQLVEATALSQQVDEPQEAEKSFDSPKREPSHHITEMQYISTAPQGGDNDTSLDYVSGALSSKQDDLSQYTDTHTIIVEPNDDHIHPINGTSSILQIVQDYDDTTLRPGDFPPRLGIGDERKSDFDADEDGGRTPIVEKSQDLDGMELLKEIQAVMPLVTIAAEEGSDNVPVKYALDQSTGTYDTSQQAQQIPSRDIEGDEIQQEDASKPKKKVVRVIKKKSKRDKPDEKTNSPNHKSLEGIDDQARSLIDEASKSLGLIAGGNHPPSPVAGRKKIVKKVVKKKKPDDANTVNHHESPEKAVQNPNEDAEEEFSLGRRKTVRRKVSKRQPPPPPSQ